MIQTEDLSKQFGDYWAVDGVSLDVYPGQVLALLGQNGAGKTTTVRMLTSVLTPTRGRARIAGFDVVQSPEMVRASVGVLTEQHGLYLRMTGREYLDFFGKVYRLDAAVRQKRNREWMEYFDLTEVAKNPIGQYSKGMRQKLALARALIHEPPVLLLDEPTSAMDPESAQLVRKAIASLRTKQRTIIICTHNLVEAEMLATKIAIIYRGRILTSGTVEELKRNLLGSPEYEVRLRGKWPDGTLNLPAGITPLETGETGPRFRVEDPQTSNPILLKELMKRGAEVVALQELPRTLEQVYLAAMARVNRA
ncbi:MAG: ABC transporter ATP-binding protein [Chloroflexi bacterium]|nr:ABC transporter ATP-binding protein [Chloroflexota bacterium]